MAIQAFTQPGDGIMIQTPVYNPFFDVIQNNRRHIFTNSLIKQDGRFVMDYEDFEEQLKTKNIKAFLLCSPHNPVGRVWTDEELRKIANICVKYNVLILTDEIHCDLIYSGHKHIPIASLSNEISNKTITFMSPSKTFNMAGLQGSFIVTENDTLRRKLDYTLVNIGLKQLNTMANFGIEAVYHHGEKWLIELLEILEQNKDHVMEMFKDKTPELTIIPPEGTYLLWIDCSKLNMTTAELKKFFIKKAGVGLNAGALYGKDGSQYMRMNIACQPSTLKRAIEQIITAVENNRDS